MTAPTGTLSIWLGNTQQQVLPIPTFPATIGRLPDNWLVLAHPEVRRRHAEIEVSSADVLITDLASGDELAQGASMTRINNQHLLAHTPVLLRDGDRIAVGPFTLRFHARALPEVSVPAPLTAPAQAWRATALPPAETVPLPMLPEGPSQYLYDLPLLYHDDDGFLGRYLKIYEALWEPLEHRQDHIALYFDPRACPERFLAWLASWIDLHLDSHLPEQRQRALICEWLELQRWRGTHYALTRALELATGLSADISVDENASLVVRLPVEPSDQGERDIVAALMRDFVPAHIHYSVEWPA